MRKTIAFLMCLLLVTPTVLVLALPQNKGTKKAKQLPESKLSKVVFIRYSPKFAKKPCDNDGTCDADEGKWCNDCKNGEQNPEEPNACYGFLSGAKPKWNEVEDYYYSDPSLGTSSSYAVNTWETATSGNIFGEGYEEDYPWGIYDYINSVSFGDYEDPNVIGVTAIWFRGKKIYEYDIMLDTDYFSDGSVMETDLKTVVLHEFGHAAGLNDLYNSVCTTEVMYGIYDGVDWDLGTGDITGIQTLYGPA